MLQRYYTIFYDILKSAAKLRKLSDIRKFLFKKMRFLFIFEIIRSNQKNQKNQKNRNNLRILIILIYRIYPIDSFDS